MVVGVILEPLNVHPQEKLDFETNNSAHSEGQQTFSDSSSINVFQFHVENLEEFQIYN